MSFRTDPGSPFAVGVTRLPTLRLIWTATATSTFWSGTSATNTVAVLLGDGHGGFTSPAPPPPASPRKPCELLRRHPLDPVNSGSRTDQKAPRWEVDPV